MRNAVDRSLCCVLIATVLLLGGCTVIDQKELIASTSSTIHVVPATLLAFEIADGSDDSRTAAVRQLLVNLTWFGRQKCAPERQARTELLISGDAASQRVTIRFRERGSFRIARWVVVEAQIIGDGFPNRSKVFELARRSVSLLDEDGRALNFGEQQLADNWREIAPALRDCARLSTAPLNGAIKLYVPDLVGS